MLKRCLECWRAYQTATATVKAIVWLATGGAFLITSFVIEWRAALLVIGAFALVVLIFVSIVFFSMPLSKGIHTPRYLFWYKNPLRRVSFNFDNYLGLYSRAGRDIRISCFQAQIKINRGNGIKPENSFIKSFNSGKTVNVQFKTREGYKHSNDIEFIPKGRYYYLQANFETLKEPSETIPIEEFTREFSGFEFVLVWEGKRFSRMFHRSEIDRVVSSFREYSNPKPARQIVIGDQ